MTQKTIYRKLKKLKKTNHNETGFTLIEMLIVVAIISILVALAIPALGKAKLDAQEAKRATVVSSVNTAKTRYMIKTPSPSLIYGQPVQLNQISPFLLIDGKGITNVSQLERGTGDTIKTLGEHINTNGVGKDLEWNGN